MIQPFTACLLNPQSSQFPYDRSLCTEDIPSILKKTEEYEFLKQFQLWWAFQSACVRQQTHNSSSVSDWTLSLFLKRTGSIHRTFVHLNMNDYLFQGNALKYLSKQALCSNYGLFLTDINCGYPPLKEKNPRSDSFTFQKTEYFYSSFIQNENSNFNCDPNRNAPSTKSTYTPVVLTVINSASQTPSHHSTTFTDDKQLYTYHFQSPSHHLSSGTLVPPLTSYYATVPLSQRESVRHATTLHFPCNTHPSTGFSDPLKQQQKKKTQYRAHDLSPCTPHENKSDSEHHLNTSYYITFNGKRDHSTLVCP